MNKKYILAAIAIILILCASVLTLTNSTGNASASVDANALEDRGNLVVDSESLEESKGLYHTDSADMNTILVKNGGALKLSNSIINKTGDTASTGDDADFYGINSAVLVNTNGTSDIYNVEITTDPMVSLLQMLKLPATMNPVRWAVTAGSPQKCLMEMMADNHLKPWVKEDNPLKSLTGKVEELAKPQLKEQPKPPSKM